MATPLEDALDGKTVSDVQPETPPEEQTTPTEPVQEAQTDDPVPPEPEPPEDESKGWQYAAYKDEKTKRQELEKAIAERNAELAEEQQKRQQYEQLFQQQQAQAQQQQDPQGAHLQQMVGQQVGQVEAQMRLNTSRMMANQVHGADKVAEAEQAFRSLAQTNPTEYQALVAQYGVHSDPVGQIMNWHKRYELMSKMGDDPDAYIQAQVQAKLAELQTIPAPQAGQSAQAPVMPTDLSQTRNVGSRSGSNWNGPTALGDALGEKS